MKTKLVLLITIINLNLVAQNGTFYSTNLELSSSLINAIYQDRKNYIWIATEDGLNQFDGVRFNIYKNIKGNKFSLKNNYVRSLYEDTKGRFWVGCINSLHQYNRATDDFREIPLYLNETLVTPHITSIIESKDGEIWITTSGLGIIRINTDDNRYFVDEKLSRRLSSMHLTAVYQDSRGNFWIASENQGLNFYNPKTDEVVIFKAPDLIGSNQISSIAEDTEGNIFVGTLAGGVFKYFTERRKFEVVPCQFQTSISVKTLYVNNKGKLLVGTDGQGIKVLNPTRNILEDYQLHSAPFDFSRMKVHAICQDKVGNLWAGLFQKGVYLDPESPNKFQYRGYKSYNQNIIGSGCVMSLYRDNDEKLWVGTDNDGIYTINKTGKSTHYKPGDDRRSAPATVMTMLDDENGTLWIGSYLNGLVSMDKKSGRFVYYENQNLSSVNENTARNKIITLSRDKFGKLWIGTSGAGIYVFDPKTKTYTAHYSQSGKPGFAISNNWINSILIDRDGMVWVGTYNGVFVINPINSVIQHLTVEQKIIPGEVVYNIIQDSEDNIWIGTSEGLACYNKRQSKSTIFTTSNGLSGNVICAILEDNNKDIWISGHSGISRYSRKTKKIENFYAFDGLQGNEFSVGAAFKSPDGEMYFGGINGITSFFPANVNNQREPFNLYLTGLYVMDKKMYSGQRNRDVIHYNGIIADAESFLFNHDDNMFAFEFSTFDFGFSERVQYSYMLEGLNSQWMITEPGVNRINFTNLGYGTYKLKVRAVIYDNLSQEKLITLKILPPWYLTWWAKMIYILLVILLIFGVSRYIIDRIQHRSELMRREHAEQISEAKLQFFINVSHEIRTPMSLILSPLEKLISDNQEPEKQKVLLLMYRNANRILTLINQLMDVRKIDKGLMTLNCREVDMVGFIDDIMQTFEYQAKKSNIKFNFVHIDKELKVWIDMMNFDKILVNILSNAFKFTPDNGEINILLKTGSNDNQPGPLRKYFEIIVSDSGIGIEEGKNEKIFERFYQINRHEDFGFGTGIGLHLTRSLVMLHHGEIFARNRIDKHGSEFIIRLPLGNDHLADIEKESISETNQIKSKSDNHIHMFAEHDENTNMKSRSKTNYKILIVDDEDDIRDYLRDELSDRYKVSTVKNGKDALSYILREKPHLIITDVVMPEMDGFTLTKKIKSNININHIPVIMLTAKASDENKAEGLETGADAYISKPFNIELLKIWISNLLVNRERLESKASDNEQNKALIKPVVLKSSDQILYEKVIRIINENIADPDLNVEFLANGVGMSRVHMHRKLKELTNQSARDFIRTIRLKQAADLLSGQKLTVSEVVYALGFTNLSHFSTSFRDFFGVSPSEYAERYRNSQMNK